VEFREAAQVDFAYFAAFFAEEREDLVSAALTPETTTALLTQPIPFHRGWRLIEESYNCVESRKLAAQDPEDQLQIQLRPQRAFWVVFRSSSGVTEEAVSPLQAEVLRRLARRVSLVEACEELENELDAGSLVILREQIQVWFQHWAELGWFCHPASA
jgi:hypothetical protein